MTQINPYISFHGNCREAMNFYQDCLGGEVNLQIVGESQIADHISADKQHYVLHSTLMRDSAVFLMASDLIRGELVQGNNVTLSLNVGSEEEGQTTFNKLSAGGEVIEPFVMMFWGAIFGSCTDRFGTKWMVNFDPKTAGQ